jgi:hypothetical protein
MSRVQRSRRGADGTHLVGVCAKRNTECSCESKVCNLRNEVRQYGSSIDSNNEHSP